jgi:hypothetical protein
VAIRCKNHHRDGLAGRYAKVHLAMQRQIFEGIFEKPLQFAEIVDKFFSDKYDGLQHKIRFDNKTIGFHPWTT